MFISCDVMSLRRCALIVHSFNVRDEDMATIADNLNLLMAGSNLCSSSLYLCSSFLLSRFHFSFAFLFLPLPYYALL